MLILHHTHLLARRDARLSESGLLFFFKQLQSLPIKHQVLRKAASFPRRRPHGLCPHVNNTHTHTHVVIEVSLIHHSSGCVLLQPRWRVLRPNHGDCAHRRRRRLRGRTGALTSSPIRGESEAAEATPKGPPRNTVRGTPLNSWIQEIIGIFQQ